MAPSCPAMRGRQQQVVGRQTEKRSRSPRTMVLAKRRCRPDRLGPEGTVSASARLTKATSTSRKAATKKTTVA